MNDSTTTVGSKPVHRVELDAVCAALFEVKDEGNGSVRRNVSLQKRYFDKKADEWKSTTCYLSPSQVSAAIRVLQELENRLLRTPAGTAEPAF